MKTLVLIILNLLLLLAPVSAQEESFEKYIIDQIIFVFYGDSLNKLDLQLLDQFDGKPVTRANLESVFNLSVLHFTDNGYPFAQVKLANLEKLLDNKITLNLELTSGPRVTIDSISFDGIDNLKTDFLLKKAKLKRDDYFDESQIKRSVDLLNALPYLKVENLPSENYYNNFQNCRLDYNLTKLKHNKIEGALGYNPPTANRVGYLFGFLDLSFYNPLGDGKNFGLQWNKPAQSGSSFNLQFDYPYPLGLDLEASGIISQEQFSDLYLRLSADLELSHIYSVSQTLKFGLNWTRITAQSQQFNSVYHSRNYQSWIGISLSSFKNNRSKLSGSSLSLKLIYLHKRLFATKGQLPPDPSFNLVSAEATIHSVHNLGKNMFADLKLNFAGYSEDESLLSPAEMIRLGGRYTIRGYSEEQFVATRSIWSNLELGAYQANSFKAYIFSDLGYAHLTDIYNNAEFLEYDNQFLFGAGFGLQLSSGQTRLDFNLGWSRESDFDQGMLYLIVENRF